MNTARHTAIIALFCTTLSAGCGQEPAAPDGNLDQIATAPSAPEGSAGGGRGGSLPFAETEVFFEFNATDNDLGFQLFLDGDAWRQVTLVGPDHEQILDFRAEGPLEDLGLTELRFESAEPSPAEVLALFAEGRYRFEGVSVDGEGLRGSGHLSHDLPPAPVFRHPRDGAVVPDADLEIAWEAIGGLAAFEVIVANEDTGASMTVELDADATSLEVPAEFMHGDTEYKAEILSISRNGNKTISEVTFSTE